MAKSVQYDTKEQLQKVLKDWGVEEPIPKKGKQLIVAWPPPANPNIVTITVHSQKSTYGKTLYKLEFDKI